MDAKAKVLLTVVLALCCAPHVVMASSPALGAHDILYEWKWVNYTFPTPEAYSHYVADETWRNVMPSGVKRAASGELFVSTPRWRPGVPSTFNVVVGEAGDGARLQPWPSWEMNEEGRVDAFQSVLGFEVDARGRAWVLDQGRVGAAAAKPGTIKLVVLDIASKKVLQKHVFPEEVASPTLAFMNDIVVDQKRRIAYIADSGQTVGGTATTPLHPGLIVYDFDSNTSRRVLNQAPSAMDVAGLRFSINGHAVLSPGKPIRTGLDGIALTRDGEWLYYCPLTSFELYRVRTSDVRNATLSAAQLNARVEQVHKSYEYATGGFAADNQDRLVLTNLMFSGVDMIDVSDVQHPGNSTRIASNATTMVWPDTVGLALDGRGWGVLMTNRLHLFLTDELDFTEVNFRVWRVYTGSQSYLYEGSSASGLSATATALMATACVLLVVAAAAVVVWRRRRAPQARAGGQALLSMS